MTKQLRPVYTYNRDKERKIPTLASSGLLNIAPLKKSPQDPKFKECFLKFKSPLYAFTHLSVKTAGNNNSWSLSAKVGQWSQLSKAERGRCGAVIFQLE